MAIEEKYTEINHNKIKKETALGLYLANETTENNNLEDKINTRKAKFT